MAGAAIGQMQVFVAGKRALTVPLYPMPAVTEGGLWRRLVDTIMLWFQ